MVLVSYSLEGAKRWWDISGINERGMVQFRNAKKPKTCIKRLRKQRGRLRLRG